MSKVRHGRGWVIVENVPISENLERRLSERSSHIYRDGKGNIINTISCVTAENGVVR